MTLKQHHFLAPERPKEEEYIQFIFDDTSNDEWDYIYHKGIKKPYNKTNFQKDTLEWESLYGEEPQPEWISFEEKEPEMRYPATSIIKGHEGTWRLDLWNCSEYHDRKIWLQREGRHVILEPENTEWADKATFDAIRQRWKDHQVKFPGFKKHIYKSTITEFSREVENKTIAVCFWADTGETVVSIINDQNEIIFEMSGTEIHLEEFEMVLKNRNIKL